MTPHKGEGEVRQKLKQLRFRHLKREIETAIRVTSANCSHNLRVEFRGLPIGFCAVNHVVCDAGEGRDHASTCGKFSCKHDKGDIRSNFQALMEAPVHEIAAKYPDIAALTWVVGSGDTADIMPGSTLVGSMQGVLLWTDSEDDARVAAREIEHMVATNQSLAQIPTHLDRLDSQIDSLAEQIHHTDTMVCELEDCISGIQRTLSVMDSADSIVVETPTPTPQEAELAKPRVSWWGWVQELFTSCR